MTQVLNIPTENTAYSVHANIIVLHLHLPLHILSSIYDTTILVIPSWKSFYSCKKFTCNFFKIFEPGFCFCLFSIYFSHILSYNGGKKRKKKKMTCSVFYLIEYKLLLWAWLNHKEWNQNVTRQNEIINIHYSHYYYYIFVILKITNITKKT